MLPHCDLQHTTTKGPTTLITNFQKVKQFVQVMEREYEVSLAEAELERARYEMV